MLRDLSEVRSAVQRAVGIVGDIKNRYEYKIRKQFTGFELEEELEKNNKQWDDYSAIKLYFDNHQNWLDRPIEEVTVWVFYFINQDIEELLRDLSNPRLRYQAELGLSAPILISLSKYVGSLMNIVKTIGDKEWYESVLIRTQVPCKLADTIKNYFEPTLFDSLARIEILIPDYGKFPWSSKIHKIFKDPFNPDGHAEADDKLTNCVTSKQLERIKSSCYPDPGGFGFKVFYDHKNLACSQYVKDLSRVKAKSGIENVYYYGGSDGSCVIDYFSQARHRLEVEFRNAYKNVQPLCTPEDPIDNSTKKLSGNSKINSCGFIIIITIIEEIPKMPILN